MIFRALALVVSILYLRYCFFRARRGGSNSARNVYFKRGAFTRDIAAMKMPHDVLLNGNILRRLFMLIVEPYQLEQIVCLYYAETLRNSLASVVSIFCEECKRSGVRNIYFGGIDYFEVAVFEKHARAFGIESVAIFHENYTIPLVMKQTVNLLSSYPEVPGFTRVYAIGPPAMDILKRLFDDVRPHTSSRFRYSMNCHEFERDLLLIPFSDVAYFAPTAFAITYAFLVDLAKRESASIVVKHKNHVEQRRFIQTFGRASRLYHAISPSASELCASSRVVVCFNSLVYFEALSRGHMIAIPAFAEARLGEIYSQHCLPPDAARAGIRTFASVQDLERILADARALIPTDRQQWAEARRSLLAQSFYTDVGVSQDGFL